MTEVRYDTINIYNRNIFNKTDMKLKIKEMTILNIIKRLISGFLAVSSAVMLFPCTILAEDEPKFVHKREEQFLVTGPGLNIQLEDANYTAHAVPCVDRNASDTRAMKFDYNNNTNPEKDAEPHIEVVFRVEEKANYGIWIRTFGDTNRSDSYFYSFDGADYKQYALTRGAYYWNRLHSGILEPERDYVLRLRGRETGAIADSVLITRVPGHIPEGRYGELPESLKLTVDPMPSGKYPATPVNPPKKTHPRVLFMEKDIPQIIENMNHPDNKAVLERYSDLLDDKIEMERTSYSATNLARIEVYALDYALFRNREHGRAAIDGIMATLENVSLANDGLLYRTAGHHIHTAGKVYDWCYDLLTREEKDKILLGAVIQAGAMENGWPPEKQGAFTGHGAEAQLLRDALTLAIAVYDERPDIWNFVGGRYFDQYVPARQEFDTGLLQGSDYGMYRQMWSAYSYMLIKGMGAEVPVDLERYEHNTLWPIYFRRPDGQFMRDGDTSLGDKSLMWEYWRLFPMSSMIDASLTKNPYIKLDFARLQKGYDIHSGSDDYSSTADAIIMLDPSVKAAKTYEGLPLSKYFGSPTGEIIARTGWDDGSESPSVVAQMKVQEYQVNGHMHQDAGHFQLYYKGILASDSGVYQGANNTKTGDGATAFGSEHFNQYQVKTVAHNCMLVYDPSEGDMSSNSRATINDGGQRAVHKASEYHHWQIAQNEKEYKVGDVQGMEIKFRLHQTSLAKFKCACIYPETKTLFIFLINVPNL